MEPTVSSVVLFPELLTRESLVKILKRKFHKINANSNKIDRWNDDEVLEFSKRFLVPKPQRQKRNNVNEEQWIANGGGELLNCSPKTDINANKLIVRESGKSVEELKCLKRKSDMEVKTPETKKSRHSPIRFP